MALTINLTETARGMYPDATLATHTFQVDIGDIIISDDQDSELYRYANTPQTAQIKYNTSNSGRNGLYSYLRLHFYVGSELIRWAYYYASYGGDSNYLLANTWGSMSRNGYKWYGHRASDFFNSSNKTQKTIAVNCKLYSSEEDKGSNYFTRNGNNLVGEGYDWQGTKTYATINLVLNVPPTFTASDITFSGQDIYAGLTTASVDVSDFVAYYGGDVTAVTFTIGSQSVTASNPTGTTTLTINPLNQAGTFTPKVTVTDSRGQTAVKEFAQITVLPYTAPAVTVQAERTLATGEPYDEGTHAVITTTFDWVDALSDLQEPVVTVTDPNGLTTVASVTWYSTRASSGALSGSVTWSSLQSPCTVYGLIDGFNTQFSYQITVEPEDGISTGTAITQTLGNAFYTVDFLAGGHGIAFGTVATQQDVFECDLVAQFNKALSANAISSATDVTATADLIGENLKLQLDTTAQSGVDHDIYIALDALGWVNDVIV